MKIGTMDRHLRPIVAGMFAACFSINKLAVARIEADFPGFNTRGNQPIKQPKGAKLFDCVWQKVESNTERFIDGCCFVHAATNADPMQRQGEAQAANSAADYNHIHKQQSCQPPSIGQRLRRMRDPVLLCTIGILSTSRGRLTRDENETDRFN